MNSFNPTRFFQYKKSVLTTEGVSISDLVNEYGTPLYVYSREAFLTPIRELQKGLAPLNFQICFAVKSNSNPSVLKMLGEAGVGMDLVSQGELFRVEKAGVAMDKVVFSGVGKTALEMAYALERKIYSFNVESVAELELLNEVARSKGIQARVALRFNPDVDAKTHPYISTGLKKNKFGLNRNEIIQIAKGLERLPNILLRGISIHIGSQILSLSPMKDSFSKLSALIKELEPLLPEALEFVDLGGGLGITYKNEKPPAVDKYCALIVKHFGPRSPYKNRLKVLVEPGRTISGNAGILVSRSLYRKKRGKKAFLIIDAAMNDLMRPALYGSYHEIIPVDQRRTKDSKIKTDIVGPVCESSDCFASDRSISSQLDTGDLVAILSAGAYGFSMTSNYNSRPRPTEVLVEGNKSRVIRERETYEDLVAKELY